jgi:hypothetical protein
VSRKFHRKILGYAGLLIRCHSIPLWSDCDHDLVALLVPLGLNVNVSSFLLKLSFMILAATSIVAPVVLKMDVCRQIPLILGRPFLNTTKSTCMKEFLILTGISFVVPSTSQND